MSLLRNSAKKMFFFFDKQFMKYKKNIFDSKQEYIVRPL